MGVRESLQAEIDRLQAKLAAVNRIGNDTFNLGTVLVFSAGTTKWYRVKVAEETWKDMHINDTGSLVYWILSDLDSGVGYFEVYEMAPKATPFFASS